MPTVTDSIMFFDTMRWTAVLLIKVLRDDRDWKQLVKRKEIESILCEVAIPQQKVDLHAA